MAMANIGPENQQFILHKFYKNNLSSPLWAEIATDRKDKNVQILEKENIKR